METRTLTAAQLRERMKAQRVTVSRLAQEAEMAQPHMSAILAGQAGLGPDRRDRIERAIVKLGLDREPEPIEARDKAGNVVFRLRQL